LISFLALGGTILFSFSQFLVFSYSTIFQNFYLFLLFFGKSVVFCTKAFSVSPPPRGLLCFYTVSPHSYLPFVGLNMWAFLGCGVVGGIFFGGGAGFGGVSGEGNRPPLNALHSPMPF
jgi:hypothetical protein